MRPIYYCLIFLISLQGCAYGPQFSTLENDIRSGSSRITEEKQGAVEFDRTLIEKGGIIQNSPSNSKLETIVGKLSHASHRPNAHFTVRILNDKSPNAFSIGGEYLYVHQGLLDFTGSNTDALACVLGHEISHDIAGHSYRNLSAQKWKDVATELVSQMTHNNKVAAVVASAAGTLVYLKYSRAQEKEADILGTVYAYRAGFDPRTFIAFFQSLEQRSSLPGVFTFVTDHPSYEDRVRTIRLVIDYLQAKTTIPAIANIDPKTANVLQTVERLDGAKIQISPQNPSQ